MLRLAFAYFKLLIAAVKHNFYALEYTCFPKIICGNATLCYDPVSACKLSSPELSYCVQSQPLDFHVGGQI